MTGMRRKMSSMRTTRSRISKYLKGTLLSSSSLPAGLLEQVSFPLISPFIAAPIPCLPVSRTCTAPFDRLKVFLITRPPELGGVPTAGRQSAFKITASAVGRIYAEGGVLAFWTGNGLSVAKIFPESAIKFFAYESSVSVLLSYSESFALPISTFRNERLQSTGIMLRTRGISVVSVASCLEESEELPVN